MLTKFEGSSSPPGPLRRNSLMRTSPAKGPVSAVNAVAELFDVSGSGVSELPFTVLPITYRAACRGQRARVATAVVSKASVPTLTVKIVASNDTEPGVGRGVHESCVCANLVGKNDINGIVGAGVIDAEGVSYLTAARNRLVAGFRDKQYQPTALARVWVPAPEHASAG